MSSKSTANNKGRLRIHAKRELHRLMKHRALLEDIIEDQCVAGPMSLQVRKHIAKVNSRISRLKEYTDQEAA